MSDCRYFLCRKGHYFRQLDLANVPSEHRKDALTAAVLEAEQWGCPCGERRWQVFEENTFHKILPTEGKAETLQWLERIRLAVDRIGMPIDAYVWRKHYCRRFDVSDYFFPPARRGSS